MKPTTQETKKEKFERLKGGKLQNVKHHLNVLSKLGNTMYYEYSEEGKDEIFGEIDKAVKLFKQSFE